MSKIWKKLESEDDREFLFTLHDVESIDQAFEITANIIRVINENNVADQTQISLSSDNVTIILHGHSKEPITQLDWDIAEQIEKYLV